MIGLMLLLGFGLYLVALAGLPFFITKVCRSLFNAPRAGKWLGWATVLVVFAAGFGITFLTWGVHDYHCRRDAGVTVLQTAEQWAKAHPSELAEAKPYKPINSRQIGDKTVWEFSDRFEWTIDRRPLAFYPLVFQRHDQVVDRKTGAVQVEKTDYFIPGDNPGEFHYGFWWARSSCELKLDVEFEKKRVEFKKIEGGK